MKKFINTGLLFLLISISGHVIGQTGHPEGKSCNTLEGRLEYIQNFTSSYFDWLLKKVERVSPETEKYLLEEYKDSISTGNESRYQKVTSNQYFTPWKLRESFNKLSEESKTGYKREIGWGMNKNNPQESEMIFYTNLLDKNYDLLESISYYQKYDRTRKNPYLGSKDSFNIGLTGGVYKIIIQDLIKCSFKK